jgi:hypothetical protein
MRSADPGFGQDLGADDFWNVIIMSGLEVKLRRAYFGRILNYEA